MEDKELKLGFSTGVFGNDPMPMEEKIQRLIDAAPEANVIEVSFLGLDELYRPISSRTIDLIRGFPYKSLHAPTDIKYSWSVYTREVLRDLYALAEDLDLESGAIVFHPPTITDGHQLLSRYLGKKFSIENMNDRAFSGKDVPSLQQTFSNVPEAGLVLDINHTFTCDPSMWLATAMHHSFGDRLAHYHISGVTETGGHGYLHKTMQNGMFAGLFDRSKPIVIEAGSEEATGIKLAREFAYIRDNLQP